MHSALKYRSGRVIPLCRVALAGALVATSWIDRDYPLLTRPGGLAMLVGYLCFALVLAVIAWRDWWLDHHLRKAAFVAETAFAFAMMYLVETSPGGPISPFMALFVFLLVSGTLIWRQRALILVTALLLLAYCITALAISEAGTVIDWHWFGRRLAFMAVVAMLVIWFGHSRSHPRTERLDWAIDASQAERFAEIASYVRGHLKTGRIALVWMPGDEPWAFVQQTGDQGASEARVNPEDFDFSCMPSCEAVLFDRQRGRSLLLRPGDELVARRGRMALSLADYLDAAMGVLVPINTETGQGALLVTGLHALSPDHLHAASVVGQEIALALDRHELNAMSQAADLARLRESLARDLHDSVVQALAGESLRLGVLRGKLAEGHDITAELAMLHQSLDAEQRDVQRIIARLHANTPPAKDCDLGATIADTLARQAERRGIEATLDMTSSLHLVPDTLATEIELLLREAVSNAVRHGKATSIAVRARISSDGVTLTIADNGTGFPDAPAPPFPRSIDARVRQLGGTLQIGSTPGLTTLSIALPGEGWARTRPA